MLGKGLQLKTTTLLVFFVVSKVFEKLVNNGIVDHLGKCGLFSDFQNGFRSSQSTADLLTVVSDRIARAFNRSGATRAMALDILKVFAGFGMVVYFTKLGLGEFQVRYLALFLLFSVVDGCEWFWMKSLHRSIYPVSAGVPQVSIVGPTLFQLYSNDIPDGVICGIGIYADDTTLYSGCDQASDLWRQLELISELESDLRGTVDWGGKWLVDFNAGKAQLVSFDQSNNNSSIDVKIDGSVLEEKSYLRCWD